MLQYCKPPKAEPPNSLQFRDTIVRHIDMILLWCQVDKFTHSHSVLGGSALGGSALGRLALGGSALGGSA